MLKQRYKAALAALVLIVLLFGGPLAQSVLAARIEITIGPKGPMAALKAAGINSHHYPFLERKSGKRIRPGEARRLPATLYLDEKYKTAAVNAKEFRKYFKAEFKKHPARKHGRKSVHRVRHHRTHIKKSAHKLHHQKATHTKTVVSVSAPVATPPITTQTPAPTQPEITVETPAPQPEKPALTYWARFKEWLTEPGFTGRNHLEQIILGFILVVALALILVIIARRPQGFRLKKSKRLDFSIVNQRLKKGQNWFGGLRDRFSVNSHQESVVPQEEPAEPLEADPDLLTRVSPRRRQEPLPTEPKPETEES